MLGIVPYQFLAASSTLQATLFYSWPFWWSEIHNMYVFSPVTKRPPRKSSLHSQQTRWQFGLKVTIVKYITVEEEVCCIHM